MSLGITVYKEGEIFIRIYAKLEKQKFQRVIGKTAKTEKQKFQGVIGKIAKTEKKNTTFGVETIVYYDPIYTWGNFEHRHRQAGEHAFTVGTGFTQDIILDPERQPEKTFSQIFEKA